MPKKFAGENSKATVARERKANAKAEENAKKEKAREDAYWAETDDKILKKQAKRDDDEKKKAEAAKKRDEAKKALDAEMQQLTAQKSTAPQKVTRAQIDAQKEREEKIKKAEELKRQQEAQKIQEQSEEVEENANRAEAGTISGRGIDNAQAALDSLHGEGSSLDKHPEKRMRAAYQAFEDTRLPQLKARLMFVRSKEILQSEMPSLRLSQLKQQLRKEWLKHPSNPVNARMAALSIKDGGDDDDDDE